MLQPQMLMRFRTLEEIRGLFDEGVLVVGNTIPVSDREFVLYTHLLNERDLQIWLSSKLPLVFRGVPLKIVIDE